MSSGTKDILKGILLDHKKDGLSTYAILDASGKLEVYSRATFYDNRFEMLLDNDDLRRVSPYLVKLEEDEITEWILDSYEVANWIIFIQSSKPYKELLHTLKSYTKTYDEQEEHDVYIRYWDPRAIEIVLKMFDDESLQSWFDVVETIYARNTLKENRLYKFTYGKKETTLLKQKDPS